MRMRCAVQRGMSSTIITMTHLGQQKVQGKGLTVAVVRVRLIARSVLQSQ